MSYKIVVGGANGFLGRNIKEYFDGKVEYEVECITRSNIDLSSKNELVNYISNIKPDYYIHTAVTIENYENNLRMHLVLEEISKYCKKVITLGSGAEYNPKSYKPMMKEEYFNNSL